jgi:hypothetical protein
MQIEITTEIISAADLKNELEKQIDKEGVQLELHRNESGARGIDPTILTAIVGGAAAALGALLTGIFKIMESKNARKIVINGSQGRRIELTGEFTKLEIDELVQRARDIDAEQIYIR